MGAGLAELAAARRLERFGRSVRVLEARDRLGGRIADHVLSDGSVIELGGQWISAIQPRVWDLAAELGLATFPTYGEGTDLTILDETVRAWRGDEDYGLDEPDRVEAALAAD